ncbi:MAG: hypothetical protein FD157_3116 [Rhodocyclaceae bacterium]|nr:MAG: hypothetical protein FD157_3116 [Rhodocyclaceae bacterium]TND03723.1 MAG: hypothetical protein FD118_1141 [Rhodocyclaceae bacterium]
MSATSSLRSLAAKVVAAAALFAPLAHAADESSVTLICEAVRSKYPDLAPYCGLADAERRPIVVGTTMQLAGDRKVSDPFVSGAQAGSRLRKDCGLGATPPVVARAIKAFGAFLNQVLLTLSGVANVRTSVVLRELKYETALPV